jgi:hypothetical protein
MLWWVQVDKLLATLPSEEGEEAVQQAILEALVADNRTAGQSYNNCSAEMWSGSEEGSYLRIIDCCLSQL